MAVANIRSRPVAQQVILTPCKNATGGNTIIIERLPKPSNNDSENVHVAGGAHKGIVINKDACEGPKKSPPHIQLEFKVFLTSSANNVHTQESRLLRFWFKPNVQDNEQMRSAQEFFKELVSPSEFPRDYVGFIKKILKMMQQGYSMIKRTELEMREIQQMENPLSRPISVDDNLISEKMELTPEKILDVIESSYPNPISIQNMANTLNTTDEDVHFYLQELTSKGVVKCMENGSYTRVTQNDTTLKIVKQMPTVVSSHQPTIAIITAQYCEKLAVDTMIENKDTYVRYKTEGESNVYTLGNIGAHRVVATKLPTVGHSRAAIIASGNTTTRLLGSFQKVDHVFLVGIGGGIPHYTDYKQHVRLGDVVVSTPPNCEGFGKPDQKYIYMYSERIKNSPDSPHQNGEDAALSYSYKVKTWCPPSFELQDIAQQLNSQGLADPSLRPWENYIKQVQNSFVGDSEHSFVKPAIETDRLYMSIGGKDVIEVAHPVVPQDQIDKRANGMPAVHFGAVGSGRSVIRDEQIRQEFAHKYGIMAYDTEYDTVVESIFGNRKDNYVIIRGISDYRDGTRKKEWQEFAALNAAAYMKAIICAMEPPDEY
ncbi:hypothetical protein GQR58_025886 [Nymphon striatum]|nr:hypothetical protein GQR58_025886 [Nymphon striatum]